MKPIFKDYDTHKIVRFQFKNVFESKTFIALVEMFGFKVKHRSDGTVGKTVELLVK